MNLRNPLLRLVAPTVTLTRRQDGNSLIEAALVLPVLLLLLAAAVDIGRAFRAAMVVNAAARTGVAYGIHNPTDVAGMVAASNKDASSFITVTSTATYGCECPDGTSVSCSSGSSCSPLNSVYYVELDSSATYTPVIPWPGIATTIPLTAKVRFRASQ